MIDLVQLPAYANDELENLDLPSLIDLMIVNEDRVPRNVIDECARRGDTMVEQLSGLVDDGYEWRGGVPGEWWLNLHAVMILGLIPTERAGLLLVKFMRRMSREEDHDLQDWLASCWPSLFHNKPVARSACVMRGSCRGLVYPDVCHRSRCGRSRQSGQRCA